MPSDRPLLTIAVPTYNRSGFLAELLEALQPQLADEERVELLIFDNASPDDTPAVVQDFRRRGLALRYCRNDSNVGADGNFVRCYEAACGEYVWILGDDDILLPGGLKVVLGHLESRRYDLFYLRASAFRSRSDIKTGAMFTGRLHECSSPAEFAVRVATSLTFISANISRKSAFRELPVEDFRRLDGTNLAQLGWTFALLQRNSLCACIEDVVVAARQENSGGIGTCRVFGTSLTKLVEQYFGLKSAIGRAIINRTVQSFFPWAMLYGRSAGGQRYIAEDAEAILSKLYEGNLRYWIFLYPVLRLPMPLARIWVLGGKVITRIDQVFGYPLARGLKSE
jgi:abequosyltransferase